ncbi:MAG: GAF domain-containing protein [candidate division Zixibacteria bacterium]|nr:GAF domain-containing protein [candidate division Zixibacteria bacterium]
MASAWTQFDRIPVAIFAANNDGEIFYTNDRFLQIVDHDSSAVDCCHGLADLENLLSTELIRPARQVIEQRTTFESGQFIFVGAGGRYYLLSISLSPLMLDDTCHGVFGILQDSTETADASESLRRRIKELNTIEEISQALHSTMKTDDILRIILTGATCKEGLGFNRAFLFLLNEGENCLEGKMAIGPSNAEEAGRIWGEIPQGNRTLSEVLAAYLQNVANHDIEVNRIVRSLKIDLSAPTMFRQVMESGHWCNIDSLCEAVVHDTGVLQALNTHRFAVVPLLSRGKSIGVILADNLITGKQTEDNTVHLLQIFADHAASAIENAGLFEEIEVKAASLEKANLKLEQVQKQIAAIEKSSLMAEITYKIAHELRNPITIIGGFAALLNRNLNPADKSSEYGRIIVEETLRVEKALAEVLNFSKSFALDRVRCDLWEIVAATVDVLEQTHSPVTIELDPDDDKSPLHVRVNRDQTVQSLHDIIEAVGSCLPDSTPMRLRLGSSEAAQRIELHWQIEPEEHERVTSLLAEMLDTRATGSSLRLTLAFETVRYNGGEPGLAASAAQDKYLFIEYPAMEE